MTFIPELVGTPLLRRAITTNSIMANVGRAVRPAVAAALVHFYGLGWCFVFNAASFALVVVAPPCLLPWRRRAWSARPVSRS
jgi:Na+-translocating ferredoxin:NAD+ oxidoreductase RnfD subunit